MCLFGGCALRHVCGRCSSGLDSRADAPSPARVQAIDYPPSLPCLSSLGRPRAPSVFLPISTTSPPDVHWRPDCLDFSLGRRPPVSLVFPGTCVRPPPSHRLMYAPPSFRLSQRIFKSSLPCDLLSSPHPHLFFLPPIHLHPASSSSLPRRAP